MPARRLTQENAAELRHVLAAECARLDRMRDVPTVASLIPLVAEKAKTRGSVGSRCSACCGPSRFALTHPRRRSRTTP